jgi:hypothetical protein
MQPDDKKKCDAPLADQSVQISKSANEPHNKYPQQPTVSLNLLANTCKFCPLTPERFHVLLNSLFKVLFNFPSRYLFAIGLVVIFSLRWSLPPDLGCTPKQPDSTDKTHHTTKSSYGPSTLLGLWPRSRGTWMIIMYRQCLVPNATFLNIRGMPDSALGSSLFARRY